MTDDQILHQLLGVFVKLQQDYAAAKIVLRALVLTHPDPAKLLSSLDVLAEFSEEVDLGQRLTDDEIAARQAAIAHWRKWIERKGAPG